MLGWGLGGRFLLNVGKGARGWSLASDAGTVTGLVPVPPLQVATSFWSSWNCHGDSGIGGGPETVMQIYYKDIIMILLVTFRSI